MSIRRANCPRCSTAVNIPAAMATVRCPSCESIWNPNASEQVQDGPGKETSGGRPKLKSGSRNKGVLVGGAVAGVILILVIAGGVFWLINRPTTSPATTPQPAKLVQQARSQATESPTPQPPVSEPYREIDLPESTRQQIYRDYRTAAGSSVDKPIPLPKDWNSRKALDATLNKILDRELTLHASMHNIEVDDVIEIIKEGNAKRW